MYRVLFVGIGGDANTDALISDLRKSGHVDFAAGIVDESQNHSHFDAIVAFWPQCLFADYSHPSFKLHPIDDVLYSQIKPVEGNILRQMDRLLTEPSAHSRAYPFTGSFSQRRHLLFDHLRFWDLTLEHYQFDAVVFANVPHLVGDTVLYSLCKARDIKTLMFREISMLPGTQFMSETIEDVGVLDLGIQLKSRAATWADSDHRVFVEWQQTCDMTNAEEGVSHVPVLPYSFKRLFVNRGRLDSDPTPWQMVAVFCHRIKALPRMYKRKTLKRALSRYLSVAAARQREISHVRRSPMPQRFLFFPLHFQPEASTSAVGRHFVELYEVAAAINQVLPNDVYLVIKEHPHQYDKLSARDPDFFDRLTRLPRVWIVDSTASSKELRRQSLGIVTVSGSNGFEAFATGKPVVSFGSPTWREAPGVVTVRSHFDVVQALTEILQGRIRERHEYLPFLARLRDATVLADLSDSSGSKSEAEKNQMKQATRINIGQVIKAWIDLRLN